MKKTLLIGAALSAFVCSVCFADAATDAEKKGHFSVKSDHRSFNPFNASYTLKGNVVAKFPNKDGVVTVRADKGVAYFFAQKVVARGHVALDFNGLYLGCDEAVILLKKKTANLYRNVVFKGPKDTITAPEGRYDWRNRVANFSNAVRNGLPPVPTLVYEV